MLDPRRLARAPFLAGLRPETLRALAERAIERRFGEEEVLFTAGSPSRGLFIVLDGRVRVLRSRADGRQHVVHEEGPGGTLGEVPLFDGGGYPATAIAAAPTRVAVLDRATLAHAMARDPEMAWVLFGRFASRVRTLVERLDRLASRDVGARLAALLLERATLAATDSAHEVTLGASQHHVAEELGTVREVVVKELRRLRETDVLRAAGRGRWLVHDLDALRRRAEGER